jgi:hypothetical protein
MQNLSPAIAALTADTFFSAVPLVGIARVLNWFLSAGARLRLRWTAEAAVATWLGWTSHGLGGGGRRVASSIAMMAMEL